MTPLIPDLIGATAHDERPLAAIPCCMDLPRGEPMAASPQDLPEGHLLDGRFRIREVVGRSGMATIYLSRDERAGGDVAVKVPHMRIESDPVCYGRFQREQRIGESLDHPSLLRFIRVDKAKSRPYIVTEYLDGCTLAAVLHRVRPLEERAALRIASAVCGALAALHSRGFIHRDLKPGNIMVCRDGRLCLMDFGIASEIETSRGILAALTPLFGTPEYMAPEQVRNRRNDQRTDIYCLGVILFEMLTGVVPFVHDDPWAAAHLRVNGDPVSPRSLNPALSPQAEEIVLRAMRRSPGERYLSAESFRAALDAPESVHITGLSQRLKAPRWRMSLQGTPLLAGAVIGVGALLFMAGLFFVLIRHR